MYTIIRLPAGIMIEAILASRTQNRMRLIAQGFSDAVELKRKGETWSFESGDVAHFEFVAAATRKGKADQPRAAVRHRIAATA